MIDEKGSNRGDHQPSTRLRSTAVRTWRGSRVLEDGGRAGLGLAGQAAYLFRKVKR